MDNLPRSYDIWQTAPYDRQCAFEERCQSFESAAREDMWLELTDELEVERFLRNHVSCELTMLTGMVQALAIARKEMMEAKGTEEQRNDAGKAARLKAYHRMNHILDCAVDAYAEREGERRARE